MGTVLKDQSSSVECLLLQALKQNLTFSKTIQVFGVVCVTCDGKENDSLTVKLNKKIQNEDEEKTEQSFPDVDRIFTNFRRRSHSADSRIGTRRSGFEPYIREKLLSAHPSTVEGVKAKHSPLNRAPVSLCSENIQKKSVTHKAPNPVVHVDLEKCLKENDEEKKFKANITDSSQRQLLEKTLKEFIKVKYQQSIGSEKTPLLPVGEDVPNLKVSPVAKDFFKMLSLQARIMGVSIPPGFMNSIPDSKSSVVNKKENMNTKEDGSDKSDIVSCDNLGITKKKCLSFNTADSKYSLAQGKFATVMHNKLEHVKYPFNQESPEKNRSISVNLPPVTDKKSKKDDKRKQVLKKQHALRVCQERYLSHSADELLNNTLPFPTDIEIKEEDNETCQDSSTMINKSMEDIKVKMENDMESDLDTTIKAVPCTLISESLIDKTIVQDAEENNATKETNSRAPKSNVSSSIALPPSAYVFKPIIISPNTSNVNESVAANKLGHSSGNKTLELTLAESDCDDSIHSCVTDIATEHSFVPREALSSLQVDDDRDQYQTSLPISAIEGHSFVPIESLNSLQEEYSDYAENCENENQVLLRHLPFSDIDNIPDVINYHNNPLSGCISDMTSNVEKRPSSKQLNASSEDSNTSFCSVTSYGFDVLDDVIMSPCSKQDKQRTGNSDLHKIYGHGDHDLFQLTGSLKHTDSACSSGKYEHAVSSQIGIDSLQNACLQTDRKPFEESEANNHRTPNKDLKLYCNKYDAKKEIAKNHKTATKLEIPFHTMDHNYAGSHSKPAVKHFNRETVSSAKKCRKPLQTRKYFPLKTYLSENSNSKSNIETEVVHMDDTYIIDIYQNQFTKVSKKRHVSLENDSICTPSKRMKHDLSTPIKNTKSGQKIDTSCFSGKKVIGKENKLHNKSLLSDVSMTGEKDKAQIVGKKSSNLYQGFKKSSSNDRHAGHILTVDKQNLDSDSKFSHSKTAPHSNSINHRITTDGKDDHHKSSSKTPHKSLQKSACVTKLNHGVSDTKINSQKDSLNSKSSNQKSGCDKKSNHHKSESNIKLNLNDSCEKMKKSSKTDKGKHYIEKTKLEENCEIPENLHKTDDIKKDVNKTKIKMCQKTKSNKCQLSFNHATQKKSSKTLNSNPNHQDNINSKCIMSEKRIVSSDQNHFELPTNCGVSDAHFPESIIVSLPIDQVFNCKKREMMKPSSDTDDNKTINSRTSQASKRVSLDFPIVKETVEPKFTNVYSKRRNSTGDVTDIPVVNEMEHQSSCHGHLLVRPIPTVHCGIHVAQSKTKGVKALTHSNFKSAQGNNTAGIKRHQSDPASLVNYQNNSSNFCGSNNILHSLEQTDNTKRHKSGPVTFQNDKMDSKKSGYENDKNANLNAKESKESTYQQNLINDTSAKSRLNPICIPDSNDMCTKQKKKNKRKSSSKKRKSIASCSSSTVIKSSSDNVAKDSLISIISSTAGDLLIPKEYLRPSLSLGRGRKGKKRNETDGSEGFKMKKRWLEMWGPGSPGSPKYTPSNDIQNIPNMYDNNQDKK